MRSAPVLFLLLVSCAVPEPLPSRPWISPDPAAALEAPAPGWDTLIAGGNTVPAGRVHLALAEHGPAWPLEGVAELLREADAALVNLACSVALSGSPVEKGLRNPRYFRARPEMLELLTQAGVDALTLANGHAGDYGPMALAETLRWTREAGLVTVGAGLDLEGALSPKLILVGRTLVALAGMDTTMPAFHPGRGRPGVNHVPAGDLAIFEERVRRLGAWARVHADLLVLTIHWGREGSREPCELQRRMAALALDAGVDLILGHSAHRLQGIEVIGGKLVVYDMGSLLLDERRGSGGLFRMRLSKAGVERLEFLPILVLAGRTVLPGPAEREALLQEMQALCASLGTRLERRLEGGVAIGVVELEPPAARPRPRLSHKGGIALPATRSFEPPRPGGLLRRLPRGAMRLDPPVHLFQGVELLGYELPERIEAGVPIRVLTWWRAKNQVTEPWLIALDLLADGRQVLDPLAWAHDPGDWALPFARQEPGEIVEDLYFARSDPPLSPGLYELRALLIDPRQADPEKRILGRPVRLGQILVEDPLEKE